MPPQVRDWIVPTNRRHPIAELMSVLRDFFPVEKKKSDK
jgi:23S rRNA (adenine2503-C2)-methyltransferase